MMTSTNRYQIPDITPAIINGSKFSNGSECSDIMPSAEFLLTHLNVSDYGLGVACLVMTILVIVLYVEEVIMLKLTYTNKDERLKVMCLLGIYPVFCVCSMCGLLVPRCFPMTDFLSTFYLSLAMFVFQRMIVLFMTGETNLVRVFDGANLPLAVPPLCCICPCVFRCCPAKVSKRSIITVRLFVLQGVFIRPILSFSYGMYVLNQIYGPSNKTLVMFMNIFKGASMMLAMFGLQIIYRLTRAHLAQVLGQTRILGKFVCFQMVILFGIVQPNIFTILLMNQIPACSPPFGSRVLSQRYINIVTIFEMFVIVIVARYVYNPPKLDQFPPRVREVKENGGIDTKVSYAADNPAMTVSTEFVPQGNGISPHILEDET